MDREGVCASEFWDTWGFMCLDPSKAATRRNYTARLVKYFDTSGGTWTVESKRIPGTRPISEFLNEDDVEDSRDVIEGRMTAKFSASNSHKSCLKRIPDNPQFTTMSARYGQRLTLEQFGVSDHGRSRSRTQLPSN